MDVEPDAEDLAVRESQLPGTLPTFLLPYWHQMRFGFQQSVPVGWTEGASARLIERSRIIAIGRGQTRRLCKLTARATALPLAASHISKGGC
jgi:hypothetical protein